MVIWELPSTFSEIRMENLNKFCLNFTFLNGSKEISLAKTSFRASSTTGPDASSSPCSRWLQFRRHLKLVCEMPNQISREQVPVRAQDFPIVSPAPDDSSSAAGPICLRDAESDISPTSSHQSPGLSKKFPLLQMYPVPPPAPTCLLYCVEIILKISYLKIYFNYFSSNKHWNTKKDLIL